MEFVESIIKTNCEIFYLNDSKSRSLQVCLNSVQPVFQLAIRLSALDHGYHIDISIESWKKMLEKCQKINSSIGRRIEEIVFINNQLKVFTQTRHGEIAVCFMDFSSQRVNMKSKTFNKMYAVSSKVTLSYQRYEKHINTNANALKSLIESITQKNCDCNKQKNYLSLVHLLDELKNKPTDNIKIFPSRTVGNPKIGHDESETEYSGDDDDDGCSRDYCRHCCY